MKIRVGESGIPGAGRGLFAEINFRKGAEITDVSGPRYTPAEVELLHSDNDYLLELNDESGDCIEVTDESRYANDANGFTIIPGIVNNAQFCSRDDHSMYLEATRSIKAGQEIFVDYGAAYWQQYKELQQYAADNKLAQEAPTMHPHKAAHVSLTNSTTPALAEVEH